MQMKRGFNENNLFPSTPLHPILLTNNYPFALLLSITFFFPFEPLLLSSFSQLSFSLLSFLPSSHARSFVLLPILLFPFSFSFLFFSFSTWTGVSARNPGPPPHLRPVLAVLSCSRVPLHAMAMFPRHRHGQAGNAKKPCIERMCSMQGLGWVYSFFILCALRRRLRGWGSDQGKWRK